LKLTTVLLLADKHAASIRNEDGDLPLHCAAAACEDVKVIIALLYAYPEAISTKNNEERLPLTCAAETNRNCEVIKALVHAYSDALLVADDEDHIPLEIALHWKNNNAASVLFNALPKCSLTMKTIGMFGNIDYKGVYSNCHKIMFEAQNGVRSWNEVRVFFLQFLGNDEMQARLTRREGLSEWTPLHIAARVAPLSVVTVLLKCAPSAVSIKNKSGNLPLHFAAQYNEDEKIASEIFNYYPEAASVPDNDGDLPLHCAAQCNSSSKVTQALLDAYPDAATVENNDGFLPHQLASKKNRNVDVAKIILKRISSDEEGGGSDFESLASDESSSISSASAVSSHKNETTYPNDVFVPNQNNQSNHRNKEKSFGEEVAKGIAINTGTEVLSQFLAAFSA